MLDDRDYQMIGAGLAEIQSSIDGVKDEMPYIDSDEITSINYHLDRLEQILCAAFGVVEDQRKDPPFFKEKTNND